MGEFLDTPTPVTLPGRPVPVDPAAPEVIPVEDTGKVASALWSAAHPDGEGGDDSSMTPEDFLDRLATKLHEKGADGNGGGDGDGGKKADEIVKEFKRHKWIAAFLSLFLGSGGMVGTFYALKAQAASNTDKVEMLKAAADAIDPIIQNNTVEILKIKADVTKFHKAVGEVKAQNKGIAAGIETLKKEAQTDKQTRLEEKVKALERQLERSRNR